MANASKAPGPTDWLSDLASFKYHNAKNDTFNFTPQAGSNILTLDVMANDQGGAKNTLFSVDSSATPDADLIQRDASYSSVSAIVNWETSSNGARYAIVNGKIAYDYTSIYGYDYMPVGTVITDTITYAIQLSNGHLSFATSTINLTVTDAAPVITVGPNDHASVTISEDGINPYFPYVQANGSITVTDADAKDFLGASVTKISLSGVTGSLDANTFSGLLVLPPVYAPNGQQGSLNWNFFADEHVFDYLNPGETLTITYTVQVTDSHGLSATQDITINVQGAVDLANLPPVVTVSDGYSSTVTLNEPAVPNTNIAINGLLSVSDPNRGDYMHASVTGVVVDDPTHSITAQDVLSLLTVPYAGYMQSGQDNLMWFFNSNSGPFEHLNPGENVTLTYTIAVSDSHGATTETPITIIINGSGAAPIATVASGDIQETVMQEDGTPISGAVATVTPTSVTANGTLTVTDSDSSGPITATVKDVHAGGYLGVDTGWTPPVNWLTVSVDPNKTANNLSWTFQTDPKFLDHIPQNGNMGLDYVIELADADGNTSQTHVSIIVTGQNDKPVRLEAVGDSVAGTASSDTPSVSGHFTIYDPDEGDVAYVQPHTGGFSVTGNLGGHTMDELLNYANIHLRPGDLAYTNVAEWAYNAPAGTFNYLTPGETVTMNYTFDVWDGHPGSFFTQSFSVTIVGAQDLPV